jgi:CRISPR-associated protein Cas1
MKRVTTVAAPLAHLVGPGKLKVVNGHLAFVTGESGPLRLDPAVLRAVYCYGPVGVTDEAMQVLWVHDVEVSWLTAGGTRCKGRLVRADTRHTTLRMLQHRALADPARRREWACLVVKGKIASQAKAARHYQRHGEASAGEVRRQLEVALGQCDAAATADELRGLEGACTAAWFGLLGRLLQPPWAFTVRTRRPPRDPVNSLLSLGYAFLEARTTARCAAAGLEVNLGGLHEYRAGRPSLVCDLMEPLRLPAVDRWVLLLCNQGQVAPADFREEAGGIRLQPERFAGILHSWEEFWQGQDGDAALEEWLGVFVSWLRQGEPSPEGVEVASDDEAL